MDLAVRRFDCVRFLVDPDYLFRHVGHFVVVPQHRYRRFRLLIGSYVLELDVCFGGELELQ